MSTPAVSIFMPVYNAMPYLEQAIQSIFAQTFTDWELVAVDDCSTDESWAYLQSIDDPRIHLARNEKNMKQSFTQNRGLDMARGKWVARMDADDIILPQRLEKQITALEQNPEIDVLGCGKFTVDIDLNLFHVTRPPVAHEQITKRAWFNFPLTHGTMVGKAQWFRKFKADPSIRLAQDFELLYRAHLDSVYANIPDLLYLYRMSGVTSTLYQKHASIYYKAKALLKNGFRMGRPLHVLAGLIFLAPRPLFYIIKRIFGEKATFHSVQRPSQQDFKRLEEGLEMVRQTEVPLKIQ